MARQAAAMTAPRIDHVNLTYRPRDDAAMKRFWLDLIGLPRLRKPPGSDPARGFWAGTPPAIMHFTPHDGHAAAEFAHVALRVAELEGLARRLEDAGHETDWEWSGPIEGITRFVTRDPGGNIVELVLDDAPLSLEPH